MKTQNRSINIVYSAETGVPDFLVVDASQTLNRLATFINDAEPFHSQNCRTLKLYENDTTSCTIGIFITNSNDTAEELR